MHGNPVERLVNNRPLKKELSTCLLAFCFEETLKMLVQYCQEVVCLALKSGKMLGKIKPNFQQDLPQSELLNLLHPLVKLAHELDWDTMESELKSLYSDRGWPSIPIRKIAGLLMLKEIFKESAESVSPLD